MGKHCEAVELLLARMDSNPEEFGDGGRWHGLILKYRTYLPAADRLALEDKINALRLDVFHKDVMKELLAEPNDDDAEAKGHTFIYTGSSTTPVGDVSPVPLTTGVAYSNQCISPNTNAAANVNLSNQSIKDIAAAMSQYAANVWRP
jgi:hypothetical protein